ncbi:MAG: PKD domain-containing protein [Methanomicrobiales archaeon]|nr:PKD domain-containing protein [Methanomicrobiales archaeon]
MADAIRVGPVPVVSFSTSRAYGVRPLTVQFTDTSSGDPAGWSWDFGDDGTSADRNPIHTYDDPGSYTVSLSATNANGTGTQSVPGFIRALNGTSLRSVTGFSALIVEPMGAAQHVALDTAQVSGVAFSQPSDPTLLAFTPPPSTEWQRMTFSSRDGIGFNRFPNGTIMGNLSSCVLESPEITPSNFGTGVGNNLLVSYRLSLTSYPVLGEVNVTVWEGLLAEDDTAMQLVVARDANFSSIIDSAYTIHFVPTNITGVTDAVLELSVNASWVKEHGNENNIGVVRLGDDGTDQVLTPVSTSTDPATGLAFFTVPSPRGLSRFGLVSATGSSNLLQMGARVATQIIQGSGMGAGSSDKPVVRDRTPWVQPAAAAKPPESPAATFYGEARLDITVAGITRGAMIISSEDRGANLLVPAGIEALDAARAPLARVSVIPAPSGGTPAGTGAGPAGFTGIAYDVGPDGATFNPPATLSFTVPEDLWSGRSVYTIRTYDGAAGAWADIPTTADPATRTLTGQVSHLCLFGVFAAPEAAATPAPPVEAPAAATPAPAGEPVPRTPMGTFTGMLAWIYTTATANPVATGLLLVTAVLLSMVFVARRRRSRITHIRRKK